MSGARSVSNLDKCALGVNYLPFYAASLSATAAQGFVLHPQFIGDLGSNRKVRERTVELIALSLAVGTTITGTSVSIKAGVYTNLSSNAHDDATTGTLIAETTTITDSPTTYFVNKDILNSISYENRTIETKQSSSSFGPILQVRWTITGTATFTHVTSWLTYREID